jgi:hypothetical protein
VKGRHAGSRDAILNNVGNLVIRKPLRLSTFRDVGRSFAASAVQAVAVRTGRGKDLTGVAGCRMGYTLLPAGRSGLRRRALNSKSDPDNSAAERDRQKDPKPNDRRWTWNV